MAQQQELLLDRILCQAQALDIAIAGAGPIGLLMAIAIKRRIPRRTIHIFEGATPGRASGTPHTGRQAVVGITANGMKALALIDEELPTLVKEAGHVIRTKKEISYEPGEQQKGESGVVEVAADEEKFGWPLVMIEWTILQKIMLLRLPKEVEIHYDRPVSGFEEDEDGVSVRFKHRTNEVRAHLLIAADGMFSTVREAIAGDQPVASGQVSWESIVTSSLSSFELAPNQHMTTITSTTTPSFTGRIISLGPKTFWQVTVDDASLAVSSHGHGGLGLFGVKEVLLRSIKGQRELTEAVQVTKEEAIYERCPHYRRPLASHTSPGKRVLLVGDAAHGMLPRLGQGANLSFEDAYYAAACLASWGDDDPATALQEYEATRLSRVNRVQEYANTTGLSPPPDALRKVKESRGWVVGADVGYSAFPNQKTTTR